MDFYKERCKDLCEKILKEEIKTTTELDKFVNEACKKYKGDNTTVEKEKKLLGFKTNPNDCTLLYGAFAARTVRKPQIPNDYTSDKIDDALKPDCTIEEQDFNLVKQYVNDFLVRLHEALKDLGKRTNVKFFSIFLGVGTGTYYRAAAAKIDQKIKKLEPKVKDLEKKLEQQKLEEQSKKKPEHKRKPQSHSPAKLNHYRARVELNPPSHNPKKILVCFKDYQMMKVTAT